MSDKLKVAMQAAAEKLDETRRIADDPNADPEAVEQARIHVAMMEDGLATATAALDTSARSRKARQQRAEWIAIVRAYRAVQARHPKERPSEEAVAEEMAISVRTLTNKLRRLGVEDWHDVHALVAAWP